MVNRTLNVISIQKTKRNESILKDQIIDYDGIELFLLDHGLLIERRENTESNHFILVKRKRKEWLDFYFISNNENHHDTEDILLDITSMFDSCAAITSITSWGEGSYQSCETKCLFECGELFYSYKHISGERSFKWPRYVSSAFKEWLNLAAI